jgi:hypothetical protein
LYRWAITWILIVYEESYSIKEGTKKASAVRITAHNNFNLHTYMYILARHHRSWLL